MSIRMRPELMPSLEKSGRSTRPVNTAHPPGLFSFKITQMTDRRSDKGKAAPLSTEIHVAGGVGPEGSRSTVTQTQRSKDVTRTWGGGRGSRGCTLPPGAGRERGRVPTARPRGSSTQGPTRLKSGGSRRPREPLSEQLRREQAEAQACRLQGHDMTATATLCPPDPTTHTSTLAAGEATGALGWAAGSG